MSKYFNSFKSKFENKLILQNKKTNKLETAYFKDWLYNCYNKLYLDFPKSDKEYSTFGGTT